VVVVEELLLALFSGWVELFLLSTLLNIETLSFVILAVLLYLLCSFHLSLRAQQLKPERFANSLLTSLLGTGLLQYSLSTYCVLEIALSGRSARSRRASTYRIPKNLLPNCALKYVRNNFITY
jgi:hypothetical protein